ncbi:MAG: ATP-binding protein, partial [Spirochaetaceae bacterium]|nr:ATP-binding protein [Spirochaetaceae bacterium]
ETTPKYYYNENGLLNLFLFDSDTRLLENLVAITLHNKYEEIYYLKSKKLDVDFFIPEIGTVVQVAYSLKNIEDDREIASILEVSKTMKEASRFVIITFEEEKELEIDGTKIEAIPVWKWLLK